VPQTDFYNHNRFIAYPLVEQSQSSFDFSGKTMRESAILDAGFMLGIEATYDPDYRVKLVSVAVTATKVTFTFKDEAASATFKIETTISDAPGTLYEVDAVEGDGYGSGWLVAGDLGTLAAEMTVGVYTATSDYYVEPGTVQSLYNHYVKQFTVGSQPDTPWHMPLDCGGSLKNIWQYVVTGRNLQGDKKFKPGYNAVVSVIENVNAIEISAGVGAGEGEPCDRVYLGSASSFMSLSSMSLSSESFSSLSTSSLSSESLESGSVVVDPPKCKDLFNTVNGVWPDALGNFFLTALSSGLRITPYPDEHKIVVEFFTGVNDPFCNSEES
jgi:hypothetical protein